MKVCTSTSMHLSLHYGSERKSQTAGALQWRYRPEKKEGRVEGLVEPKTVLGKQDSKQTTQDEIAIGRGTAKVKNGGSKQEKGDQAGLNLWVGVGGIVL